MLLEAKLKLDADAKLQSEAADGKMTARDAKMLKAYETAVAAGSVDPKSYLGVQFREALKGNPQETADYAGLSRGEAALFRIAWAKKMYEKWKESRTYKKAWRRIDTDKGVYMSSSQLVLDDGGFGDPEAVKGATRLMKQNFNMGGSWVKTHPQTKRTLFLKLKFEYREEFEECWANYQKEATEGAAAAEEPAAAAGDEQTAKSKAEKAKAAKEEKSKAGKEEKSEAGGGRKKSAADKLFDDSWSAALKQRTRLMAVIAQGQEVLGQITSDTNWSWAHNPQNHGHLQTVMNDLRNGLSGFSKNLVAEEPATIRKRHTRELIAVELVSFSAAKPAIDRVAEFVRTLQKRHIS